MIRPRGNEVNFEIVLWKLFQIHYKYFLDILVTIKSDLNIDLGGLGLLMQSHFFIM